MNWLRSPPLTTSRRPTVPLFDDRYSPLATTFAKPRVPHPNYGGGWILRQIGWQSLCLRDRTGNPCRPSAREKSLQLRR